MKKQFLIGLFFVIASTLSYYVPVYFAGLKDFDLSTIPTPAYIYFNLVIAGAFTMNVIYTGFIFIKIEIDKILLKLIIFYLIVAELYTLINHITDKFLFPKAFDLFDIILFFIIFSFVATYVIFRAVYTPKSDKFDLKNTYIVKFKPKNTLGIINQIIHGTGHKAIYQDGKIYQFKKKSRKIEEFPVKLSFFDQKDIIVKKTNRIDSISKLLNKNYNTLTYNCNTFVKEALNES